MNRNVRFREADLGRVSMKLRWSLGERRIEKGYSPIVWSWIFIDTSVNFDIYHRVFRRRLGVDSSFASGVCEDDDYVHAKRNDEDEPQNSGRPENGKASHSVVWMKQQTMTVWLFCLWLLQTIELSANAARGRLNSKILKTLPQPPKNTARTLMIQRIACYSRVGGYKSASN